MLKKVEGGYQIQSHKNKDKIYPKVYKTKKEAEERIDQMVRHSKPKKK